jgi:hypothetical protein
LIPRCPTAWIKHLAIVFEYWIIAALVAGSFVAGIIGCLRDMLR